MINFKNRNIPYRLIAILFFTILLSSCLKETAVLLESAFTVNASEDNTSPLFVELRTINL